LVRFRVELMALLTLTNAEKKFRSFALILLSFCYN
jgi:hypothetical protein